MARSPRAPAYAVVFTMCWCASTCLASLPFTELFPRPPPQNTLDPDRPHPREIPLGLASRAGARVGLVPMKADPIG